MLLMSINGIGTGVPNDIRYLVRWTLEQRNLTGEEIKAILLWYLANEHVRDASFALTSDGDLIEIHKEATTWDDVAAHQGLMRQRP